MSLTPTWSNRCLGIVCLAIAAAANGAMLSVADDTGRRVTLNHPAARIVTLSPHATELVFAAGAGDKLIAVASYSDYPAEAAALPRIGGSGGVDRERLLQLQPDLVVAWHSGSRLFDLAWLDRRGIPVFRSEPQSLNQIPESLRKLGVLAGTTSQAQRAAELLELGLARVCRTDAPVRRTYYQLWDRPALTYGGRHWANDALTRIGFVNVFADVDRSVFSPAEEAVLARHPDLVLASELTEVGRQIAPRVIRVPTAWDRPTPRILAALRQVCGQADTVER